MANTFTPTQQAMLAVLADGREHRRSELIACIDDPEPTANTFHQALLRLRHKLRASNQTVECGVRKFRFVYYLSGLRGKAAE